MTDFVQDPVLYSELFWEQVLPDEATDWDNLADDIIRPETYTAAECKELCQNNAGCLASVSDGEQCKMSFWNVKLGGKREPANGHQWSSSWNRTTIVEWARKQPKCEGTVRLPVLEELLTPEEKEVRKQEYEEWKATKAKEREEEKREEEQRSFEERNHRASRWKTRKGQVESRTRLS